MRIASRGFKEQLQKNSWSHSSYGKRDTSSYMTSKWLPMLHISKISPWCFTILILNGSLLTLTWQVCNKKRLSPCFLSNRATAISTFTSINKPSVASSVPLSYWSSTLSWLVAWVRWPSTRLSTLPSWSSTSPTEKSKLSRNPRRRQSKKRKKGKSQSSSKTSISKKRAFYMNSLRSLRMRVIYLWSSKTGCTLRIR